MTTLGILKSEIADDLDRTDLSSAIASEIEKAITFYQTTRFYFNETRDVTFSTVAAQKLYTLADNASIPTFIEFDQINIEDGTSVCELEEINPKEWELLTAGGNSTGRPFAWTYFNQSIGLYPIPNDAYTVRLIGHITVDAPADDATTGNAWMVEAFDLIRTHVVGKIARRKTRDFELAAAAQADSRGELDNLKGKTASRVGTGFVTPSDF